MVEHGLNLWKPSFTMWANAGPTAVVFDSDYDLPQRSEWLVSCKKVSFPWLVGNIYDDNSYHIVRPMVRSYMGHGRNLLRQILDKATSRHDELLRTAFGSVML